MASQQRDVVAVHQALNLVALPVGESVERTKERAMPQLLLDDQRHRWPA